jgi:hypothetical protein
MEAAHRKTGLSWKGRQEAAGLIQERPSSAKAGGSGGLDRSETCGYLDGDLD